MKNETTICALATPGSGAIAVIRISGPDSYAIVEKVFQPATAGKILSDQAPNTIHLGSIHDGDNMLDEVLVSLFRAPTPIPGRIPLRSHAMVRPIFSRRSWNSWWQTGQSRPGPANSRSVPF